MSALADAVRRPIRRYTRTAQALHWLTALLVLAVLPLAWAAVAAEKTDPARPVLFQFHKSVGLTIFAIVAVRILWRAFNPPPPEDDVPPTLVRLGRINHVLLYAAFLLMPVSGFLLSAFAGNTTQYFYLFPIPGFAKDEALQKVFKNAHLTGQWVIYLLVSLHLLASLWHAAIRRDRVLARMLPGPRREGPA